MGIGNQEDPKHTDLRTLVYQAASVQASMRLSDLYSAFSHSKLEFMAVLEGDRVIGLSSRRDIGMLLGSQFGRALNMRKPVRDHMLPDFARFSVKQGLPEVLRLISSRPRERFYDDAVLVDEQERFLGLIAVSDLIRVQNRLLLSNIQELRARRDEIDRHNRDMEQDLLMARELQLALLPDRYPAFVLRRGESLCSLSFYHRYQPLGSVGGDFFQIVRVSPDCAGVFVCDVMGHGVRSALVTAMLRALIEELKPMAHDPGKTLTQMNHDLSRILQRLGSPMYATALYAVLDLRNASLRVAKAGHPDALHFRTARQEFAWLQCSGDAAGPALGFFADANYDSAEFPLEPGDALLLYTDGLIEVHDRDGEELGEERLLTLANAKRALGMPRLCDELLQSADRFSGGGGFNDDVCLVGIEARATNESNHLSGAGADE